MSKAPRMPQWWLEEYGDEQINLRTSMNQRIPNLRLRFLCGLLCGLLAALVVVAAMSVRTPTKECPGGPVAPRTGLFYVGSVGSGR